jgi:hypothetical protein
MGPGAASSRRFHDPSRRPSPALGSPDGPRSQGPAAPRHRRAPGGGGAAWRGQAASGGRADGLALGEDDEDEALQPPCQAKARHLRHAGVLRPVAEPWCARCSEVGTSARQAAAGTPACFRHDRRGRKRRLSMSRMSRPPRRAPRAGATGPRRGRPRAGRLRAAAQRNRPSAPRPRPNAGGRAARRRGSRRVARSNLASQRRTVSGRRRSPARAASLPPPPAEREADVEPSRMGDDRAGKATPAEERARRGARAPDARPRRHPWPRCRAIAPPRAAARGPSRRPNSGDRPRSASQATRPVRQEDRGTGRRERLRRESWL